jgi:hypothetical protein
VTLLTTLMPSLVATRDPRAPSVADVGALLRERTRAGGSVGGAIQGVFNERTQPTDVQVEPLLADAVREVRLRLGAELDTTGDDNLLATAQRLAAIRAAMYIEMSYYPEDVSNDESSYGRLKEMWDENLAAVLASLRNEPGDTQGFGSIRVLSPTAAAMASFAAAPDPWVL